MAVVAVLRKRIEAAEVASIKFERPSVFTVRTPVEVEIYGNHLRGAPRRRGGDRRGAHRGAGAG